MQKLQKIDLSIKKFVGPEDDLYFKAICDTPFDEHEQDLSFLIKKYLNEDAVYFDVGANIGATAVPIANYLKYGLVYAFEPSFAYTYLEENIKIQSLTNVRSFNVALGEREGATSFKTEVCSAYSHRITDSNFLEEKNNEQVRIRKLDDLIKEENIDRVDLIKIDVEGYEEEVLDGCDELIEKFNPIFYVEFNLWGLIAFKNESPRDFLQYLCEKFTNIYWIRNGILLPLDTKNRMMEFLYENLAQNGCIDHLICLNGDIELRKRSKIWFNSNELPTEIGQRGSSLLSKKGKSGLLSYGPYVPLAQGTYIAKMHFMALTNCNNDLGAWDIYIPRFDKIIAQGNIVSSDDFCLIVEADFEITCEFDNVEVEIRTFSNGHASLGLKSIIIERIWDKSLLCS